MYTPLFYTCSKTELCRGIPTFRIFAPKHRLWVLVRTASPSKNKKKKKLSIFNFYNLGKFSIPHGRVFIFKHFRTTDVLNMLNITL